MRRMAFLALWIVSPLLIAQEVLNNDAVIKLVKSGLSEDLIITTVKASPGNYDTSADGLIALKNGGVSDKIVTAIMLKAAGGTPASASVPADPTKAADSNQPARSNQPAASTALTGVPPGINNPGIYYRDPDNGSWLDLDPEPVTLKSGGGLKHIASAGIVKTDMNGIVSGTRSKLSLRIPASFILYVPEGRTPSDYQLLRFHPNGSSREFRATIGGASHESGGDLRDSVDYLTKKIAQHVYTITLGDDIGQGEYGFLPLVDVPKNTAASGKIYTFTLVR
jgi:hypothetical protein